MMTSRELKVGDKVVTYDGKFEGVVSLVKAELYLISFPGKNIPPLFYKKDTLILDGWHLGIEGLKQILPLQDFYKEDEKETIELYLDDEDDYVD